MVEKLLEIIEEIEKEIDTLYKKYYNTGYRESAEKQKLMLKIAALKYKIKNLKKDEDVKPYQRINRRKSKS